MTKGMQLEVANLDALSRRFDGVSEAAAKKVRDDVTWAALAVQNDYRRAVAKGPASGNVYRSKVAKKEHRASAPGEAPATDSGRLLSSINFVLMAKGYAADVGSFGVPYSHRLEFGGMDKRGIYIAPRPALIPALKKNREPMLKRLRASIKEALK